MRDNRIDFPAKVAKNAKNESLNRSNGFQPMIQLKTSAGRVEG